MEVLGIITSSFASRSSASFAAAGLFRLLYPAAREESAGLEQEGIGALALEGRQAIELTLRSVVLEPHILAIDVTGIAKPFPERGHVNSRPPEAAL
jgi:hypothetical protein